MDQDFKKPFEPDKEQTDNPEITTDTHTDGPAKPEVFHSHHHHKPGKSHRLLVVLLVLLLAGGGAGAWWYHQEQLAKKDAKIEKLQGEVHALSEKLSTDLKTTDETAETEVVTDANREAIQEAVTNKAYGDLTPFFGESVTIILAASEGLGARTPTQAVEDLAYLNSATAPWNFELDEETLTAYGTGGYATYFPEDAVVGKSANNYVVSFSFTSTGEISTIFIAPDAELL